MRFFSPLRYPGGKGKLSYYIKSIIVENSLHDGTYIEPYAGGSAIALELLLEDYMKNIVINDYDPAIYAFWETVVNNSEQLCSKISTTKISMDTWNRSKSIINNIHENSLLDIAFSTFFLNRTNRSGILKAGVIGGKSQSGKWKMDARFNKIDLISRIEKIANYSSRIQVLNYDCVKLIEKKIVNISDDALFYLDPPYYVKGQVLYRNYYNHSDHIEVMNAISKSKIKNWLVSYDNVNEIKEMYSKFRKKTYSLQYSAQSKVLGSEVMIYSDNIKIPTNVIGKYSSDLLK
ncbi:DNA methyltransferase [Photobacterium frigidiphilum]|uniref:site-specific DNA-methyltransferase (adenine-specific) n=1 Tax=Photobacterium frigidiphilum TaxID=264736 RepID=A0A2T3J642_9GAMM|nr:DNA adenine methylase [Photobacterium frigidiphilum]PSU42624.1 DNA methyltransferase [Photobacterium frigidiphilum]